jgi:preprotein translocase subunit YajC
MTLFFLIAQAVATTASESSSAVATPSAAGPALLNQLVLFAFIIGIFYFLMIRPQQKKQREHLRLLQSLKTGDKVVMTSGIHGMISNVKEKTILLKVADNVKIEFDKSNVALVEKTAEVSA